MNSGCCNKYDKTQKKHEIKPKRASYFWSKSKCHSCIANNETSNRINNLLTKYKSNSFLQINYQEKIAAVDDIFVSYIVGVNEIRAD